jgi:MFS family permease
MINKTLLGENLVFTIMNPSFRKVIVSCVCVALLFLARGAFNPYFFPIYENLTNFSYYQIAFLLNVYMFVQAISSPLTGKIIDSFKIAKVVYTFLALYIVALIIPFYNSNFWLNILGIALLGTCLIALKNSFCVTIINNIPENYLRRTVAIRSVLINLGSYTGNTMALYTITTYGAQTHLSIIMSIIILIGALFVLNSSESDIPIDTDNCGITDYAYVWKNRQFLSDAIKVYAAMIPYGCWGTIIPKFAIDLYHSEQPVLFIYGISVSTTVIFSYFVNSVIINKLYKYGFRWEWCKWLAFSLFLISLSLLSFAQNYILLAIAIFIFILGEIIISPYCDELAKKYADKGIAGTGSYLGILGLFSGFAILTGSTVSLLLYGLFKESTNISWFWPSVIMAFIGLTVLCYFIAIVIKRSMPYAKVK